MTWPRTGSNGAGKSILYYAVDPSADHSSTASAFLTRDRTACRDAYHAALVPLNPTASAEALDDAAGQWMTNQGMGDDADYSFTVDDALRPAAKLLADDVNAIAGANDGITIVHFDFPTGARAAMDNGGILGSAIDVNGATRNKCCFVLFTTAVDTFVHEIGHHLFYTPSGLGTISSARVGDGTLFDAVDPTLAVTGDGNAHVACVRSSEGGKVLAVVEVVFGAGPQPQVSARP